MTSPSHSVDLAREQYHLRFETEPGLSEWVPVPGVPRLEVEHSWVPFHLDLEANRVHWAPLTKRQLRKADFLDSRLLRSTQPDFIKITSVGHHDKRNPAKTLWLFHFGHCGSTSLSRALGASFELPTFREPGMMWSFFRQLEQSETLTSSQVEVAKNLISIMTHDLGPAIIKPSSLHMELIAENLVEPISSKALFLVHSWRTCLLNGLKNLEPNGTLGGDYPMYERSARKFWKRHGIDVQFLADLAQSLPGPVASLLIGWLGKISMLHYAWHTLDYVDNKVIIPFEDYVEAPCTVIQQIAQKLKCQMLSTTEVDIRDLGKGRQRFETKSFAKTLGQLNSAYQTELMECDRLIKKIYEGDHKVGLALRFFQDAVGLKS